MAWAGGGEIRDSKATGWTIDSMAAAAFAFADKVRECPQRTQYVALVHSLNIVIT